MVEYIYLIQEREFINAKKEIYKPGRTAQENGKRFVSYPKDSKLLLQIACKDCLMTENIILKQFKEKYKQRKDIGREYFEGNYEEMMNDIMTIIMTTELTQKKEQKRNILIDAYKKSIYENIHDISDNNKNIGKISILHDDAFGNSSLRVKKIKIVEGHDNKETLIEIINYIQKEYSQMEYWIIVCDNLNIIKDNSDNEYTEPSENIKQIIIDILKNDKNYHCFQMEQLREYHLVVTKIDHIKDGNKECDILLKFSEPVHFPINHKNDKKLIEKFGIVNDKTLYTCKRKFKSRIITKVTENKKKYKIVDIIFDKPIIIISDKIVSDIYLKFIHKNEDYTPSLDNNDIFTMDYRLNKMMLNDNYTTMVTLKDNDKHVELYVIKSMSYYATADDYIGNCTYVCPYEKLCTMVSKINTI